MKKFLLLSLIVASAVLVACLLARNNSSLEGLAKANVEALASVPVEVSCFTGGYESIGCTSFIDLEDEGGNTYHYGCSISCPAGTYSCCNITECKCISY